MTVQSKIQQHNKSVKIAISNCFCIVYIASEDAE